MVSRMIPLVSLYWPRRTRSAGVLPRADKYDWIQDWTGQQSTNWSGGRPARKEVAFGNRPAASFKMFIVSETEGMLDRKFLLKVSSGPPPRAVAFNATHVASLLSGSLHLSMPRIVKVCESRLCGELRARGRWSSFFETV